MKSIYQVATLTDLLTQLKTDAPVFIDTETAKYYSDTRLFQIYQEHWTKALLFDIKTSHTSLEVLWDILVDCHLVLQNGLYDFYTLKADLGNKFKMPMKWTDTFYLSRLVYPEWQKYSLDKSLARVIGFDPYDACGLNKKVLQKSFERIMVKEVYIEGDEGLRDLTDEQYLYGAIDVYELPKLYHKVKHFEEDPVYFLDKKTAELVIEDKYGLPVDEQKLQELIDKDNSEIAIITKQLPQGLNVNSYMQVRPLLGTVACSDEEKLSIIINRPEGLTDFRFGVKATNGKFAKAITDGLKAGTITGYKVSFGEAEPLTKMEIENDCRSLVGSKGARLEIVETNYKHSQQIVEYAGYVNAKRKALKRLNFAERAKSMWQRDERGTYRIKGHFSPHAINGRIQVDQENLSQYPRTMKSMWGHKPGSGRKLIYSDFAQVELRIICSALPEMNMYKSLKEGIDLHTFVGNNLNLTQEQMDQLPGGINPRFIAKQCNFLLLYGGGNKNFQNTVCKLGGVWFDNELTQTITSNWKDIFSDIKQWHLVNNKSKTMMDETVLGRRYKADTVTDLNNIKVSGTGSEIFKLWQWYLKKYLALGDDCYIVNRVHDSLVIDAPDDPEVYEKVARNVVKCAQKAWFEVIKFAPLQDVPMPCDVSVGNNWEDLEYERNQDYTFTLEGMYMFDKELENELEGV